MIPRVFGFRPYQNPIKDSFSTTIKKILELPASVNEQGTKTVLTKFFVNRLFNEIYKLDKDAGEDKAYSVILEKVKQCIQEDFREGELDATSQRLEPLKHMLGLSLQTSDGAVYAKGLKSSWLEALEMNGVKDIFEGTSKEFKLNDNIKTKDELYAYLKESATAILMDGLSVPTLLNQEEFCERLTNNVFLNSIVSAIHGNSENRELIIAQLFPVN